MLESNGLGYVAAPEHVTPHIGMTARFFGFKTAEEEDSFASRKVDSPSYRNRLIELCSCHTHRSLHLSVARGVLRTWPEKPYGEPKGGTCFIHSQSSTRLLSPFFCAPPPPRLLGRLPSLNTACSYKNASREVLEETRLTATDPVKQFAISFFDNKFTSLIPLKIAYFIDRKDSLDKADFLIISIKVCSIGAVDNSPLAIATSSTT